MGNKSRHRGNSRDSRRKSKSKNLAGGVVSDPSGEENREGVTCCQYAAYAIRRTLTVVHREAGDWGAANQSEMPMKGAFGLLLASAITRPIVRFRSRPSRSYPWSTRPRSPAS